MQFSRFRNFTFTENSNNQAEAVSLVALSYVRIIPEPKGQTIYCH